MYGADDASSRIVEQLKLPMTTVPGGGLAYNVMFKVDLSHLMPARLGNLHVILNPEMENLDVPSSGPNMPTISRGKLHRLRRASLVATS